MDSRPNRGRGTKRPRYDGQSKNGGGSNRNWQARNGQTRRHQRSTWRGPNSASRQQQSTSKQLPPPPIPNCSVCHQAENPKYKCPKCRLTYCSIACCQQHKITCQGMHTSTKEEPDTTNTQQPQDRKVVQPIHSKYLPPELLNREACNMGNIFSTSRAEDGNEKNHRNECGGDEDDDDLDDDWKITPKMKESMNECDWLKRELQDAGLRQMITQVVAASRIVQRNGKTAQENSLQHAKATNPMFTTFCDKLLVVTGILERQEQPDSSNNDLEEWLERRPEEVGQLVLKTITRQRQRLRNAENVVQQLAPTRHDASKSKGGESEDSSSCEESSIEKSSDSSSDADD